jgi:hypothetical protein
MARIDVQNLGYHGAWVDGYLPDLKGMQKIARLYRNLDTGEYGFSQAGETWSREDFFGSIASAIRAGADRDQLPSDVQPAPCCLWLTKIGKRPTDSRMMPLYEETLADPRGSDYYHIVTIHEACPAENACLDRVIKNLHFEPKPETAYANPDEFRAAAREMLTRYLNIMAAPWLEVERLLELEGGSVTSGGP